MGSSHLSIQWGVIATPGIIIPPLKCMTGGSYPEALEGLTVNCHLLSNWLTQSLINGGWLKPDTIFGEIRPNIRWLVNNIARAVLLWHCENTQCCFFLLPTIKHVYLGTQTSMHRDFYEHPRGSGTNNEMHQTQKEHQTIKWYWFLYFMLNRQ